MRARHKIAQKQEEQLAERLGGKRQPGSGNQWHSKGDVITEDFLCEAKYTDKDRFLLTRSQLEKTIQEMNQMGKIGWLLEIWFRKKGCRVYVGNDLLVQDLFSGETSFDYSLLTIPSTRKSITIIPDRKANICYKVWDRVVWVVCEEIMQKINEKRENHPM